jgi:hypothetical protein
MYTSGGLLAKLCMMHPSFIYLAAGGVCVGLAGMVGLCRQAMALEACACDSAWLKAGLVPNACA